MSSDSQPSPSDPRSIVLGSAVSLSQRAETPSVSSVDGQQPVVQVMHLRVREDGVCDAGVHAEQVAKIVKGLQDIQIGDSAYVLPVDGSNIERQVKRVVQDIHSLEFGDMETARLIVCDGQGDVDAEILEAEVGPPSNAKPQQDSSRVTTGVLHKMIEELEENNLTKGASPEHGNKDSIANWEESEEKFIRIIQPPDEEQSSVSLEIRELSPDSDVESENFDELLRQGQQVFVIEEDTIAPQEDGNHSRDLLDNSTNEEPYWCTAGLITAVVSPQHCEELRPSTLEGRLEIKRSQTSVNHESLSVVERDVNLPGDGEKRSKDRGKNKQSLGRRLRKFFSRFKPSKDS